ncbi:hypothetical protein MBANPS3_009459 [Mucor bainieri]
MDASRTNANKDKVVGNVKDTVGGAVGNESLQAKGQAQNASGQTEGVLANVQSYVAGAADQVTGAVKGAVNSLTGDNSGEAGAKVQEKKVRQTTVNNHVNCTITKKLCTNNLKYY